MPDSRNLGVHDPGELAQQAGGQNYLLAIGIDQYEHVGKLSNAVRDAQMVSELLAARYGFADVELLFDKQATRRGIRAVLREQISRVSEKDNLVIYFSGHGHYDEVINEAYWVPVDARYGDDTDYVSYDYIQRSIWAMRAHHIFLIVDSCYSGAVLVRKRNEPLERFEKDPSRWILASGRNEVVPDGISGSNSPFARQLLDVLNRYAGEGIRVSTLVDKVTTAVIHDSVQTPIGRPLYQVGDKGGEFVFRGKLDEKGLWEEVKKENTVESYKRYLGQFPHGIYAEEAHWGVAKFLGSSVSYMQYLEAFPKGKYVAEALELLKELEEHSYWEQTLQKNTYTAYVEFLQKYPDGIHAEQAWQKRREFGQAQARKEAWQKAQRADKLAEYRSFIERFEGSPEAKNAQARIEVLEEELIRIAEKKEKERLEAEMNKAWEEVQRKDSQEAYEQFLQGFPGSPYERKARIQLEKLKKRQKPHSAPTSRRESPEGEQRRRVPIVWAMIVLCGSIGFVYLLRNLNDSPESIPSFPKMIPIAGGSFMMGSNEYKDEKPIHEVRIDSFELAETEVTFDQYDYFCKQTKRKKPDDEGWGRGTRPVINVSWKDAVAYCKWLSEQTGHGYRLPTEAEWEYAAGGGAQNQSKWAGTNSENSLRSFGNFSGTGGKDRFTHTAPVKSLEDNPLGLYDMSGNVWEWCADWYGSDFYANSPTENPMGPASGSNRVYRGGSWDGNASSLRVANRIYWDPGSRGDDIGFRPARTP